MAEVALKETNPDIDRILAQIKREDEILEARYANKLKINSDLTRVLVSFQGNKKESGFRWFKYKEGFSSALVNYCMNKCDVKDGSILDPFAGSGAALFASSQRNLNATGIELLPIGIEIMKARKFAYEKKDKIKGVLKTWLEEKPWAKKTTKQIAYKHLRITHGAFPKKTETQLERYLGALSKVKDLPSRTVLRLALLSILEEISYTRKDGQYLRWDYRSGRKQGAKVFDKGTIKDFDAAICSKLNHMIEDIQGGLELFSSPDVHSGKIDIISGSCLQEMPKIASNTFSAIMTSPPYCNRYDYTRTYALELALLGIGEDAIRELRQCMLSCTVENREKSNLHNYYKNTQIKKASNIFDSQKLINLISDYLEAMRREKMLNNSGIARMVKNYFWEMTPVLMDCYRILKPNAPMIMVNDNVRYAGVPVPVDLILSQIAESIGFETEVIWVLPNGKGNSSQQMGIHGRQELRKCVYVWRATKGKRARR